ncbi:MAG: hypothetical protein LUE64_00775 [Candidatus Gastranaerophilales bacterium]|nr:hypothetical protein [Candidatus Gastranaerophilales bacterium]
MDNSVNYNPQINNLPMPKEGLKEEKPPEKPPETCFEDTSWCDDAAVAISEEFDDMDSFLDKFKQSGEFTG